MTFLHLNYDKFTPVFFSHFDLKKGYNMKSHLILAEITVNLYLLLSLLIINML
jgi:hypothetical protein